MKYSEQMTFRAFAFGEYDNSSGISEVDWYNAQVAFLNAGSEEWQRGGIYTEKSAFSLMRWYEYTLTLEPGQTLTNTVTAPLYPAIDAGYTPSIYSYTYLLSPAKTWAQFGELKIVVNTPYYMTENNQGSFSKTEKGYELTLPGLPEEELTFTLSESEHPRSPKLSLPFKPVFLLAGIVGFLLIGGGVIAVVLIIFLIFRTVSLSSKLEEVQNQLTQSQDYKQKYEDMQLENMQLQEKLDGKDTKTTGNSDTADTKADTKKDTASTSSGTKEYTVKEKDTMWTIAQSQLGNGADYQKILDANGLKEGDTLVPGTVIKIPQ